MVNFDNLYEIFFRYSAQGFCEKWYNVIHSALNLSIKQKRDKRIDIPFYFSSHTVHISNKVNTEKRRHGTSGKLLALRNELQDSIELDKRVLVSNFSNFNTNDCFKLVKSMSGSSFIPGKNYCDNASATTDYDKKFLLKSKFQTFSQLCASSGFLQ